MTGSGAWPRRLLLIVGVSVALRLAVALYLGDRIEPVSGAFDQVSYDALARRVAEGHGFTFGSNWWPLTRAGEPTAHWSFLYTLYLAAFYLVLGPTGLFPRLVQAALVGVLHPWLIWRLTRRVSGEGPALVAAFVTAVYPYFVFYSAALVTEAFFIVAILGGLWLTTELMESPSARGTTKKWALLGMTFGAATLLRQVVLSFYPVLLAWVLAQPGQFRGKTSSSVRGASLATLILVLMIAPWSIRNYLAFGQFIPLNTNAGFAFFWGNHPVHGSTFIPVLPDGGPSYGSLVPEPLRRLDEAALDRRLLGQGARFVLDDPIRFVWLTAGRAAEFFRFWPTSGSSLATTIAGFLSFAMLVPFAVVALVKMVWGRPRIELSDPRKRISMLLLLFCATHTAAHIVCWGLIRYRLPVDAVLAVFSGSGIALSAAWVRRLITERRVTTVGGVALMHIRPLRLSTLERLVKRFLDLTIALFVVVLVSPLGIPLAILIKRDSPGPVFYRRRVLGVGGYEFDAIKFRTMYVDAEALIRSNPGFLEEWKSTHKLQQDPRVTKVGRWLRRYSLDELPQLVNVLIGQMTLVGPRMITREELTHYGPLYRNLLSVKPGLTGLWQVSGRSDVSYEERVRMDMHYVRNYSIWKDLQILFVQTLPAVVKGRGAR